MPSSYTPLGFVLPVTGELSGVWGTIWNNSGTSLIDAAIAGSAIISTDANVTLTTTDGAANQARNAILLCSGARTAQRTITAPAQSKIYIVINSTTGGFPVKIVGVGPTTGVTVQPGATATLVWNGSDFVQVGATTFAALSGAVFTGDVAIGAPSAAAKLDVSGNQASNIVAVAALDIDCSAGNYFTKTIAANSTFTFSNAPASRAYTFTLELTHTSGSVTWPASVKWPNNVVPSLTAGRTSLFVFVTDDGGSLWRGSALSNYTT